MFFGHCFVRIKVYPKRPQTARLRSNVLPCESAARQRLRAGRKTTDDTETFKRKKGQKMPRPYLSMGALMSSQEHKLCLHHPQVRGGLEKKV